MPLCLFKCSEPDSYHAYLIHLLAVTSTVFSSGTQLGFSFSSLWCYHLPAVWKVPASLPLLNKPKVVWVLAVLQMPRKECSQFLPESLLPWLQLNVGMPLPQCSFTAETRANAPLFCLIPWHFVCRPVRNSMLSKGTFLAYFLLFTLKITSSFFFHDFICLPPAVSKFVSIVVTYEAPLQEFICNPPLSCVARFRLIPQQITSSAFFLWNFRKTFAMLVH